MSVRAAVVVLGAVAWLAASGTIASAGRAFGTGEDKRLPLSAGQRCEAADSLLSEVRVREAPGEGRLVGSYANGALLHVSEVKAVKGTAWARVPGGWVLGGLLTCTTLTNSVVASVPRMKSAAAPGRAAAARTQVPPITQPAPPLDNPSIEETMDFLRRTVSSAASDSAIPYFNDNRVATDAFDVELGLAQRDNNFEFWILRNHKINNSATFSSTYSFMLSEVDVVYAISGVYVSADYEKHLSGVRFRCVVGSCIYHKRARSTVKVDSVFLPMSQDDVVRRIVRASKHLKSHIATKEEPF